MYVTSLAQLLIVHSKDQSWPRGVCPKSTGDGERSGTRLGRVTFVQLQIMTHM